MSDKKNDPKGKNQTDDLLEGFDDSFDEAIDLEQANEEKTEFFSPEDSDEQKAGNDKTEIFSKEVEPFGKSQVASEKTQVVSIEDEDHEPVEFKKIGESQPRIQTEDLAGLIEDSVEIEGGTEDVGKAANEATRTSQTLQGGLTEDLGALIDHGDDQSQEGKTDLFEVKTEDFSAAAQFHNQNQNSDDDETHVQKTLAGTKPMASAYPEHEQSHDLSSLIEEEIIGSAGGEGKTEDLSSMIDSDSLEGVAGEGLEGATDDEEAIAAESLPAKKPTFGSSEPAPIAASEESLSPARSEASKTIRVRSFSQKYLIVGVMCLLVVGAVGVFKYLKNRNKPAQTQAQTFSGNSAVTADQAAPAVIDTQELLKELEEKYNQANQYFITDRFQSYSAAADRLEEILKTYPNHKKASARLAEAILLKFDGYVDSERRNRVFQLLEKAEAVDANSVETLRAKARLLMIQGKTKDAIVRVQQALHLNPNDADSLQTQGEIQLADSDYKEALASFSSALQIQPNANRSKYFYYLTLERQGQLKEAAEGFNKITTDMNVHPKSFIERYVIEAKEGKLQKAKDELQQYLTSKESDLSPPESSAGWKEVSSIELKLGNMKSAIDALEKAVSKLALDHEAAFQLGNLYFKQNNFEKASQYYSTASTLDSDNVDYLLQLGISLRNQGRLKESEEALRKVTTKAPKNFDGLYQYSFTKYKLGFTDDVLSQLQMNIKENPQFLQGKILLGNIQLDQNDLKSSLANFQQVLTASKNKNITKMVLISMGNYYLTQELWAKSKQYFTQASQIDPENYDIQAALAKISVKLGSVSDVETHLHQMEKINPNNSEGKILRAQLLARQKEYDKSVDLYKEIIKTQESDYETRVELAKVYIDQEKFPDAIEELNNAYKYNAEYFYTFFYLGVANRGVHDLVESERNLIKATTILPNFYKGHYELGLTYLQKDDIKKGEDEMKLALKLDPTFTQAKIAMGDYYFEHDTFGTAVKYYEQGFEKDPDNLNLMTKLAQTYHELNNDKKSIAMYQKIIRVSPRSASAYLELGVLYEENTQYSAALASYQKSISLKSDNPKPFYQLGFLYRQLGQPAKAVLAFRQYLKLSPDALDKKDIEDEIKKLGARP